MGVLRKLFSIPYNTVRVYERITGVDNSMKRRTDKKHDTVQGGANEHDKHAECVT